MPQRWGIWMAVNGDLRFLSHHDMMRAVERIAVRARLPLRYSQGFNPRPAVVLVCPRPVGVATRSDLLVVTLDAPVEPEELLARMNAQGPTGLRFLRAEPLAGKKLPQPTRITYEVSLTPERAGRARKELARLNQQQSWEVERRTAPKRKADRPKRRRIDIKPFVTEIDALPGGLRFSLRPKREAWARPGEVLRLVGLDEHGDLAATVRTAVDFET